MHWYRQATQSGKEQQLVPSRPWSRADMLRLFALLAAAVAAAAASVIPYAGYAPHAVVPAPYVGTPVAHGLGLPEAATYLAPPVRTIAEAPIVEQAVEPVEQWGYKVAY